MQRMQRITGRFMTRTPNEADVEAMLKDFDDSKMMLEKVRSMVTVACSFRLSAAVNMWGCCQTRNVWHGSACRPAAWPDFFLLLRPDRMEMLCILPCACD